MVAIGPQTERQSDFMVGHHGVPFPVLSDPGNQVAEQFGLVYDVPDYHRVYYRSILVNIPFVNGDEELAAAAARDVRDRARWARAVRRSPCRLPGAPGADRGSRSPLERFGLRARIIRERVRLSANLSE